MENTGDPAVLLGLTVYLLSRTARLAKGELDKALRSRGLRLRHMAVLAALREGDPVSQLALGGHVRLDPSDVTSTVDELEGLGLVERTVDPLDRRRRLVRSTAAGEHLLGELCVLAERVADDLLTPLAPARRARFHEDLLAVLRHVRGDTPGPLAAPTLPVPNPPDAD